MQQQRGAEKSGEKNKIDMAISCLPPPMSKNSSGFADIANCFYAVTRKRVAGEEAYCQACYLVVFAML